MNHSVMVTQMEILLKFEEMCQEITKEFSPLFSKVKSYSVTDRLFLWIYIVLFALLGGVYSIFELMKSCFDWF